jgi:heptosyltransferase-3
MSNQIKKILFITLSNIGDVIMTTPIIEYLSKKYPQAKFDIVGDIKSKEIFTNFPKLNCFIYKDKSKGFIGLIFLIKKLREQQYDLAVDLRTDGILYFIKAKKKFHKKKYDRNHSVINHFRAIDDDLSKIGKTKIWINSKEPKLDKFLKKNKQFIVFALGAKSEHKVWPVIKYIELAKLLTKSYGLIVLVGDKNDIKYLKIFKKFFRGNYVSFVGKLNLLETAFLIKNANILVGNDSGLGHIASAVGTKSFTIFGDGNPQRYMPWGKNSYFYQNLEKDIKLISSQIIFNEIERIL